MGIKYFAFVVGNEVSTVFAIDDDMDGNKGVIAGMRSEPIIIETEVPGVTSGWKYIDGQFYSPVPENQEGPGYELDD
tara:strand:+ start:115 stop:345 length:231 start_codon:yes stop_codon:yes gene_type:complete